MSRGLRLFGHPLHALLSDVPVGLWALAPLWDAVALWGDQPTLWAVGFWTTLAGCLVALVAAGAGFVDFVAIDPDARASTIAVYHLAVMLSVVAVFAGILWVRGGPTAPVEPRPYWILSLDALGVATLGVGGWLGGHLVFHHRVGVDADAEK